MISSTCPGLNTLNTRAHRTIGTNTTRDGEQATQTAELMLAAQ